jgi:hypothetical protein
MPNLEWLGQAECAPLPSGDAACALVHGDDARQALRTGLIAAGIYAAGERKNLLRNSVGGALAIEAFVLGWAYFKRSG